MLETMTHTGLLDCLSALPAVDLKGFALLEAQALTDRDAVREAVVELIAYTSAAQQAARRLYDVPPVPLTTVMSVEWVL